MRTKRYNQPGSFAFGLFLIILLFIGFIGYVSNMIKLSECDFEAPYKAEVIHTIGIIPPVGMITGWMDFGK